MQKHGEDEVKGEEKSRRRVPGAQVAQPWAEQREMAEELRLMQHSSFSCHDGEESCNGILAFTLTASDNRATCSRNQTGTRWSLWAVAPVSAVQAAGGGRQEETCLPGHSTSETDSEGVRRELRCSTGGPWGPSVPFECS